MVGEGEMEEVGEMGETMMTSLWMRERVSMHWRGVGDDWVIVEDEVVQGWVRPMGEATGVVATKMTFHENNKDNNDKRERNPNIGHPKGKSPHESLFNFTHDPVQVSSFGAVQWSGPNTRFRNNTAFTRAPRHAIWARSAW